MSPYFQHHNVFIAFLLVLLGSILPDIDSRESKINQWTGIVGKTIAFFSTHRGFYHSLLFHGILFFIVQHFFNTYYAASLFLGYTAHMIGDGVTPAGIRLLYPFSSFRIRGPIKTGGFMEGIVMLVLVFMIIKILFF